MYELVNVFFPFASNSDGAKLRPGFIITPPFGTYDQVIVAYVTTKTDEILETDILLNPKMSYFEKTGLRKKSLVKLHRLSSFQPNMLEEGQGEFPSELIPRLKQKLAKIFQINSSN